MDWAGVLRHVPEPDGRYLTQTAWDLLPEACQLFQQDPKCGDISDSTIARRVHKASVALAFSKIDRAGPMPADLRMAYVDFICGLISPESSH